MRSRLPSERSSFLFSSLFFDKVGDTRIGVCQFEEYCTVLMIFAKTTVWRFLGGPGAAQLANDGSGFFLELTPHSIDKIGAALVDVCGAGPTDTICCLGCGTGALPTLLAQHTGCKAIGFDLSPVRSMLWSAGMLKLLDLFGDSPSFNSQVYLERGDILDLRELPSCKILVLRDEALTTECMAHISRLISIGPQSLQYVISFARPGSSRPRRAGACPRA